MMMLMVLMPAVTLILMLMIVMTTAALILMLVATIALFFIFMMLIVMMFMMMLVVIIAATAVIVVMMMLMTMFMAMLVAMHSAIPVAVGGNMPHAGVIVILATMPAGAALRMLAIILIALDMTMNIPKAAHLSGAIAHLLQVSNQFFLYMVPPFSKLKWLGFCMSTYSYILEKFIEASALAEMA